MHQPVRSKYLTVIDVTRVHFITVCWCQCKAAESFQLQLLQAKLFPATFEKLSTAFTFVVLDDFVGDNLECSTSGMNYYSKLQWMTSGVFPHLIPVIARQWRLLKLLKWNGFLQCEQAPKKGELGLFCAACPQPGINVDLAEDLDHWKYTCMLVMDGNFKAKHMHNRHPADQVWLMDSHGFMVTDPDYWAYLNCSCAINQANAQWGRLHSTRIGAMACTQHGCFYLHSVVDFQKGER
ncbi:hypothetical protein BKA82DRAFT_4330730 [Pisolithus tinctorius]|nr:hypothetical protein BKA82DRAFT_4330730 [Pisolithus tinctorius]